MQALFIGQTYIDVTFVTDSLPVGDEKTVAQDYAISFGGNAVTAAFCCAKLEAAAGPPHVYRRRLARPHVRRHGGLVTASPVHHRKVRESLPSPFIMPREGQARHRAPPRRPLPASLSATEPRRLPRPASRRPPAGRGAALRQGLPRSRHPDLPRRRRVARQHPRAARRDRRGGGGRAAVRADEPEPRRDARAISSRAAAASAASRSASAAWFGTTRTARRGNCPALDVPRERVVDTKRRRRYPSRRLPVSRDDAARCALARPFRVCARRPRPIPSSTSATRRACPIWPTSKRPGGDSGKRRRPSPLRNRVARRARARRELRFPRICGCSGKCTPISTPRCQRSSTSWLLPCEGICNSKMSGSFGMTPKASLAPRGGVAANACNSR